MISVYAIIIIIKWIKGEECMNIKYITFKNPGNLNIELYVGESCDLYDFFYILWHESQKKDSLFYQTHLPESCSLQYCSSIKGKDLQGVFVVNGYHGAYVAFNWITSNDILKYILFHHDELSVEEISEIDYSKYPLTEDYSYLDCENFEINYPWIEKMEKI